MKGNDTIALQNDGLILWYCNKFEKVEKKTLAVT